MSLRLLGEGRTRRATVGERILGLPIRRVHLFESSQSKCRSTPWSVRFFVILPKANQERLLRAGTRGAKGNSFAGDACPSARSAPPVQRWSPRQGCARARRLPRPAGASSLSNKVGTRTSTTSEKCVAPTRLARIETTAIASARASAVTSTFEELCCKKMRDQSFRLHPPNKTAVTCRYATT